MSGSHPHHAARGDGTLAADRVADRDREAGCADPVAGDHSGLASFPKAMLFVVAATILGVLFGLLVIWFLEQSDSTLRSGEEVRSGSACPAWRWCRC